MRDEPNGGLKCLSGRSCRPHKGCWFIETAGRCPWKSGSAKECVTTHLPNEVAPKLDGAQAADLYPPCGAGHAVQSKETWGSWRSAVVRLCGTGPSADLGVSSKYSSGETLKTDVGKGSAGSAVRRG